MDQIFVSSSDLRALKRMYKKTDPGKTFMFKGHEVLKEYSKYLIEHVENNIKKQKIERWMKS
jgi:hypothetical protein